MAMKANQEFCDSDDFSDLSSMGEHMGEIEDIDATDNVFDFDFDNDAHLLSNLGTEIDRAEEGAERTCGTVSKKLSLHEVSYNRNLAFVNTPAAPSEKNLVLFSKQCKGGDSKGGKWERRRRGRKEKGKDTSKEGDGDKDVKTRNDRGGKKGRAKGNGEIGGKNKTNSIVTCAPPSGFTLASRPQSLHNTGNTDFSVKPRATVTVTLKPQPPKALNALAFEFKPKT